MTAIMRDRAATERFGVLLTGGGSIARRHARNLRELAPAADILMVCRGGESRRWAAEFGATVVPSVEDGLRGRPRIAVICSASASHARDLKLLMPEVEGLYIEKPVITEVADLQALQAVLDAGWDKPNVVGCNLRYLGAVGKLKEACDSGLAGEPAAASLQVGQWLPDWRGERDYRQSYSAHRSQGGGVIFDLVHELDSACFLFGDIAQGQAAAGRAGGLAIDADGAAAIVLMMGSGLPVQVSLDYVSRRPVREYRVVGDAATLRLDLMAQELVRVGPDESRSLSTVAADWDLAATYRTAMWDLLNACETGSATRYSLRQAMHTTSWMIRLENSAWRMSARAGERQ